MTEFPQTSKQIPMEFHKILENFKGPTQFPTKFPKMYTHKCISQVSVKIPENFKVNDSPKIILKIQTANKFPNIHENTWKSPNELPQTSKPIPQIQMKIPKQNKFPPKLQIQHISQISMEIIENFQANSQKYQNKFPNDIHENS